MTKEEFDKTGFCPGMRAVYMRTVYNIVAINFFERLFALTEGDPADDPIWVRCENAELLSPAPTSSAPTVVRPKATGRGDSI